MVYTSPQVGSHWVSDVFYFLLGWFIKAVESLYYVIDLLFTPLFPDLDT